MQASLRRALMQDVRLLVVLILLRGVECRQTSTLPASKNVQATMLVLIGHMAIHKINKVPFTRVMVKIDH